MSLQEALHGAGEWIATAVMGVLGWFSLDTVRKFRGHGRRIGVLEASSVTRDDLETLRLQVDQTITNACDRIERRTDEILLHLAKRGE